MLKALFSRPTFLERVSSCRGSLLSEGGASGGPAAPGVWVSAASCAFCKQVRGPGHPQARWRHRVRRREVFLLNTEQRPRPGGRGSPGSPGFNPETCRTAALRGWGKPHRGGGGVPGRLPALTAPGSRRTPPSLPRTRQP